MEIVAKIRRISTRLKTVRKEIEILNYRLVNFVRNIKFKSESFRILITELRKNVWMPSRGEVRISLAESIM